MGGARCEPVPAPPTCEWGGWEVILHLGTAFQVSEGRRV